MCAVMQSCHLAGKECDSCFLLPVRTPASYKLLLKDMHSDIVKAGDTGGKFAFFL